MKEFFFILGSAKADADMTNPPAPQPTRRSVHAPPPTREVDDSLLHAWELRRTDSQQALDLASQAHSKAVAAAYTQGQARARLTQAFCQVRLCDFKAALQIAEEALSLFGTLDDPWGTEQTLGVLGMASAEIGNPLGAIKYLSARYKLCEGRADRDEADALAYLASAYSFISDYTTSLSYDFRGLELCQALGYREGEQRALPNVADTFFELGHYQDALHYFLAGLALQTEADDPFTYALCLCSVGRTYRVLGDYQQAQAYQQQSLALREKIGDRRGVSYALNELAAICRELGELKEGKAYLHRSLTLVTSLDDKSSQFETYLQLGALLARQRKFKQALGFLSKALALAQAVGNKADLAKLHYTLFETHKARRRLGKALEHFELYSQMKDAVAEEASSLRLQGLRVGFETERAEKEREIYRLKNVELAHANAELQALNDKATGLLAQLERQAKEDALTGLSNRRHADLRLHEEFTRARRFNHTLSVALCDIDNFKKINDTFSHHLGDEVLRVVARLFQDHLREVDTVARYGGEEFLLLFPETSIQGAFAVCKNLCQKVAAYPWNTLAPGLRVTLSIGVSDDSRASNHEKLVALADAKQYEAKRKGKNQVRG